MMRVGIIGAGAVGAASLLSVVMRGPPACEIEIVHRRSQDADAEAISINLQAVPSFEAFGRFIETANPFAIWAQAVRMAWFPWLGVTSALMLPWSGGRVRLNSPGSPNATNEQTQR